MIIKSVKLNNFRSHETFLLSCWKMTTMITGENGGGKTSILEAIYEATQGKSFRAVDREILKRGEEFYRVELDYTSGEKVVVVFQADGSARGGRKTFLCRDKKFLRLPKKYKYPVVLFLPDDLGLVSTSPSKKREYFDRSFGQLNEGYYNSLLKYNKALKQRNELLKSEFLSAETAFSWNLLLAKYGVEIRKFREKMIKEINEKLTDVYRGIAENKDEVFIKYEADTEGFLESEYLSRLEKEFARDKILGHTGFGVHRDNYSFWFNKSEADGSASRGEVRSIVIALKFIEAEMILKTLGKEPIVLLDDVFSELDEMRQKSLVKNFKKNQVFITSVNGVEDI
ncbi:DNA replication and repair protein RecF [Candidatus Saccharibacteria bacterium]|nr:DNA replication and repair protein RecF [Candidatus Saccharibacteria bacterium]